MTAAMLTVGGRSFRCRCAANVFTHSVDPEYGDVYACNACGTEYHDPTARAASTPGEGWPRDAP